MKAITVKQPWANFIRDGKKTIEIRCWSTEYRGDLAIHAGNTIDKQAYHYHSIKNPSISVEPRGCIIAIATLADIIQYTDEMEFYNDIMRHRLWLFPQNTNRPVYGFVLSHATPITPVISCKGKLSLWEAGNVR